MTGSVGRSPKVSRELSPGQVGPWSVGVGPGSVARSCRPKTYVRGSAAGSSQPPAVGQLVLNLGLEFFSFN